MILGSTALYVVCADPEVYALAERFLQRAISAGFEENLSEASSGDLKLADALLAKLTPPSDQDLRLGRPVIGIRGFRV